MKCLCYLCPLLLASPACGDTDDAAEGQVIAAYADLTLETYREALDGAIRLRAANQLLATAPTSNALAAARVAWLSAREPYGRTEAFRFYAGPIDGYEGPESRINGWPLDEGYIEQILADPSVELSPKNLALINEGALGGPFEREKAISTGYHAIEYLLWGADTSPTGPGERPHTDFAGNAGVVAPRGAFLVAASELLVTDLEQVVSAWEPNADNYRRQFVSGDKKAALTSIFTGVAVLSRGELAAERMDVALNNDVPDQEDEHSCFSDNTHNDLRANALGIQNVWHGRTRGGDGPGIDSLIRDRNPRLARKIDQAIATSVDLIEKIPAPFDQVIVQKDSPGYRTAQQAVDALYEQADRLVEGARLLGLKKVSTELPE